MWPEWVVCGKELMAAVCRMDEIWDTSVGRGAEGSSRQRPDSIVAEYIVDSSWVKCMVV